ncbi:hypothetical protein HGRIS_002423 [Hohenbuehelia grisea]|uniref:Uncharacterized protein n=1 Tax=Hohenbuehelia grisea TaxID=104357 RepID=A0ABR3JLN2_9AGAR
MKECWKTEINAFEKENQRGVAKEDFPKVFGTAFLQAFTEETVLAVFRVTGVHPFDNTVIKASQMQPSQQMSTTTTFPLLQTSPVRAVLAAFRDYRMVNPAASPPIPSSLSHPRTEANPGSATLKLLRDPASNPDLPTPSKRM